MPDAKDMNDSQKAHAIRKIGKMESFDFHRNYSGRGMMGQSCLAISGEKVPLFMEIGQEGLPSPNLDQLGLGIVAYWPSLSEEDLEG